MKESLHWINCLFFLYSKLHLPIYSNYVVLLNKNPLSGISIWLNLASLVLKSGLDFENINYYVSEWRNQLWIHASFTCCLCKTFSRGHLVFRRCSNGMLGWWNHLPCMELWEYPLDDQIQTLPLADLASPGMKDAASKILEPQTVSSDFLPHKQQSRLLANSCLL